MDGCWALNGSESLQRNWNNQNIQIVVLKSYLLIQTYLLVTGQICFFVTAVALNQLKSLRRILKDYLWKASFSNRLDTQIVMLIPVRWRDNEAREKTLGREDHKGVKLRDKKDESKGRGSRDESSRHTSIIKIIMYN